MRAPTIQPIHSTSKAIGKAATSRQPLRHWRQAAKDNAALEVSVRKTMISITVCHSGIGVCSAPNAGRATSAVTSPTIGNKESILSIEGLLTENRCSKNKMNEAYPSRGFERKVVFKSVFEY